MKRTRTEGPKNRRDRGETEVLPLDPRDPDVVRVKALSRAGNQAYLNRSAA
jgi:hypothetical protein